MPDTVIVIPCYNEAERLDADAFRTYADGHDRVMLLFVDDGSTDDTASCLERLCADHDRLEWMSFEENAGKAETVRRGLLDAFAREGTVYAGFWDADLATPLEEIDKFLDIFARHPEKEMVFGSRVNLLGRRVRRHLFRHYVGRIFATAAATVLGLGIYDTQCGAKMFKNTPAIRALFEKPFLSRWIFDVEILARLITQRRNTHEPRPADVVYEQPLMQWHDVHGSKLRTRDGFIVFSDLWRIRRAYLR